MPVKAAAASGIPLSVDIFAGALLIFTVAVASIVPALIAPSGALDDKTLAAILTPHRWFAIAARLLTPGNFPHDIGQHQILWLHGARIAVAISAVITIVGLGCACGLLAGSAAVGALLSGTAMMTLPMARIFASANFDAPAMALAMLGVLAAIMAFLRPAIILMIAAGIFGFCAALLDPVYLPFPFLPPLILIAASNARRPARTGSLLLLGVFAACAIISFTAALIFARPPHPTPVIGGALLSYGGLGLVIAVLGVAGLRIRPATRISNGVLAVIGVVAIAAIVSGGVALAEIALMLGTASVAGADRGRTPNLPVLAICLGGFLTGGPLLYGLLAGLPLLAPSIQPGK